MAQWSIKQALGCLIGSVCLTLCCSVGGYVFWQHHKEQRLLDEKYNICAIVQTGPEKEALKTAYLAELLDLSIDKPTSLYAFHCRKAERKLLSSPLISHAAIKRLDLGAIYIDYEVRKPVAILADYKNIAIDQDGYLFPMAPFFSPKEIPEIYLGLPAFGLAEDAFGRKGGQWLVPMQNRFLTLAFEILHFLDEVPWREGFRVKRIDVSNAFAPSLGQREVVLSTEEEVIIKEGVICVFPKFLRLAPQDYAKQISHFCLLRRNMEEDYRRQLSFCTESKRFTNRIIDLRIPQLAFIEDR